LHGILSGFFIHIYERLLNMKEKPSQLKI